MADGEQWLHGQAFDVHIERAPDDVFAYLVEVGHTPEWRDHLDEYEVLADGSGARFRMRGRVLLDSWYLRLAAPLFKLLEDRNSRRQVRALVAILERG